MSVVIHSRVVEQLTRLRVRYVADRLDAVLNDAADGSFLAQLSADVFSHHFTSDGDFKFCPSRGQLDRFSPLWHSS